MTPEERFERIERNLDILTKIHLDSEQEWRERMDRLDASIAELRKASAEDAENIRRLARIAEIHERRISDLEGEEE
jgi:hypothetical protein